MSDQDSARNGSNSSSRNREGLRDKASAFFKEKVDRNIGGGHQLGNYFSPIFLFCPGNLRRFRQCLAHRRIQIGCQPWHNPVAHAIARMT